MRIAVIGVGAIGGYFAAQAARGGHEVLLCTRSPFDQLWVETAGETLKLDAPVLSEPSQARPADWVLLATKAHQTPQAAGWLAATCHADTRAVVVLQNGVEHEERVRPYVRDTTILPATVLCGAEAVAPGRIVHHAFARLEVPAGALADELADLFAAGSVEIIPHEDIVTAVWRKLLGNVVANPITALTGRRLEVLSRPDLEPLALGLLSECIRVANAAGASIPPETAQEVLSGFSRVGAGAGSSMLYDRLAGRPLEHDALTGAVVRIGARHGIPTPYNTAMLGVLAALSEGAEDP